MVDRFQVYSNTRFFARAGGRRPEAALVTIITFSFFFLASHVLPYVPSILASTLILFIGIELMIEALWDSTKYLIWCEWAIVLGTTVGCSAVGFVPGIGVGLMIVVVLQFWHHVVDARPHITLQCTTACTDNRVDVSRRLPPSLPRVSLAAEHFAKVLGDWSVTEQEISPTQIQTGSYRRLQPPIIRLSGHAGFMIIPPLKHFFVDAKIFEEDIPQCLILDLSTVSQMETCVAQLWARVVSELAVQAIPGLFIVVGPRARPSVLTSLRRAGLTLQGIGSATEPQSDAPEASNLLSCLLCESLEDAIAVCRDHIQDTPPASPVALRPLGARQEEFPIEAIEKIVDKLVFHISDMGPVLDSKAVQSTYGRLKRAGLVIREVPLGDAIACPQYPSQPNFMVLHGLVVLRKTHAERAKVIPQVSIRDAVRSGARMALCGPRTQLERILKRKRHGVGISPISKHIGPFELFDVVQAASYCAHASGGSCWILDIDPENPEGVRAAEGLARGFQIEKH